MAAALAFGIPAVFAAIVVLFSLVHPAAARVLAASMIGAFSALILLSAARSVEVGPWVIVSLSSLGGAALGILYGRSAAARSFSTWLAPGILIFPLIFLLRPGVRSLVAPNEQELPQSSKSTTPVVLVVFDGLPLTSLLDEHHLIDRDRYPSFAALADDATWYRNATTVSDYTRWAVPAILSGRYPRPAALPTASDHPDTIFSLLGSSHTVSVHEPISRLCPQTLCDYGGEGVAHELRDFADTLAVAYLIRSPGVSRDAAAINQDGRRACTLKNPGECG